MNGRAARYINEKFGTKYQLVDNPYGAPHEHPLAHTERSVVEDMIIEKM